MDTRLSLLLGVIVGCAVGLLGGLIGTYFSIRNTNGPRERAFMIRFSVVAWIGISAFLFGLFALPKPFNFLLWLPYAVALPLGIVWGNRRQRRIRLDESASNHPHQANNP